MKLNTVFRDKGDTIHWLENEKGVFAAYSGAPKFTYTIGNFKVLKDGTIYIDPSSEDEVLIQKM